MHALPWIDPEPDSPSLALAPCPGVRERVSARRRLSRAALIADAAAMTAVTAVAALVALLWPSLPRAGAVPAALVVATVFAVNAISDRYRWVTLTDASDRLRARRTAAVGIGISAPLVGGVAAGLATLGGQALDALVWTEALLLGAIPAVESARAVIARVVLPPLRDAVRRRTLLVSDAVGPTDADVPDLIWNRPGGAGYPADPWYEDVLIPCELSLAGAARVSGAGALALAPEHDVVTHVVHEVVRSGADRVVIDGLGDASRELMDLAVGVAARGIDVWVASTLCDALRGRVTGPGRDGVPLLRVPGAAARARGARLRRLRDVVGAAMGLALASPLLIGLSVLIGVTSRGPILFRQTRIGRDGRPFTFFKFRTMVHGTPPDRHRAYVTDLMQSGRPAGADPNGTAVFKLVDDPRVTRVGRFLRRTSLDELPQLLNVLRGDMSLVGPRPCLPYEWELYDPWQRVRLRVTPGCTGLWQVTGRSRVSVDGMIVLDLHYIATRTFWRDASLILRTVPVMVCGRGGH